MTIDADILIYIALVDFLAYLLILMLTMEERK